MAAITKTFTVMLGLGWLAAAADAFHAFGRPLPSQQFNTALSALIVASLLDGIVWILRGPGYYKVLRLGEEIGEQRERRRHRCPSAGAPTTPPQRLRATIG